MAGEWFLPVETPRGHFITYEVPTAVILENARRVMWPSGIYTCQIPDENAQLRTLYVGIDTGTVCHVTCM